MTNDKKGKSIYKKWLKSLDPRPDVIYFFKYKYYPIDGFIVLNDCFYGFELKYRVNYSISDFDSVILEKKKYEEMVNLYQKKFDNIQYVNIFNDGKMCLVSIKLLLQKNIEWFELELPKDEDKTQKVKKVITKIPLSWCKILNYN